MTTLRTRVAQLEELETPQVDKRFPLRGLAERLRKAIDAMQRGERPPRGPALPGSLAFLMRRQRERNAQQATAQGSQK